MKGIQMTTRPEPNQPDWLIPAVLATVAVLFAAGLVAFFAVRSTSDQDDRLAGQLERWTTCLRSEGAPVPLVEPVGDEGFSVTVDEQVLDIPFDYDSFTVAFDLCLDDAPEGVQTVAAAIDGISRLPFGVSDLGWLGPLLFEFGDFGMFDDSEMIVPPFDDLPLDELCDQLSEFELLMPDAGLELLGFCDSASDV
jgi:hypothetical protein